MHSFESVVAFLQQRHLETAPITYTEEGGQYLTYYPPLFANSDKKLSQPELAYGCFTDDILRLDIANRNLSLPESFFMLARPMLAWEDIVKITNPNDSFQEQQRDLKIFYEKLPFISYDRLNGLRVFTPNENLLRGTDRGITPFMSSAELLVAYPGIAKTVPKDISYYQHEHVKYIHQWNGLLRFDMHIDSTELFTGSKTVTVILQPPLGRYDPYLNLKDHSLHHRRLIELWHQDQLTPVLFPGQVFDFKVFVSEAGTRIYDPATLLPEF